MSAVSVAKNYLGKTNVGFTIPGQCVAFYNQVNLDFLGVKYPIQKALGAVDILGVPALYSTAQKKSGMTVVNTRPDLVKQVKNNPADPNQLPQIGDWVIWNKNWGGGLGHISCVESADLNGFVGIEQNFVENTVTRQRHDWTNVAGWIHYVKQPNDLTTEVLQFPKGFITNKQPTNVWNFDVKDWSEIGAPVRQINKGETFSAVAKVTNNHIGAVYYQDAYMYANNRTGVNMVDLSIPIEPDPQPPGLPEPEPEPVPPTPDPVPEPTPEPEPPVEPPVELPDPAPPTQDTALVKLLKAIWSIISKLFKRDKK